MVKKMAVVLIIGLLVGAAAGSWAAIHQPHMIAAYDALKKAKEELAVAEHNKGGHRERAIDLVNKALAQTKMGIEAGEKEK